MATINKKSTLIVSVIAGLVMTATLCWQSSYVAAAPTKSLDKAVKDGDVAMVGDPYAVSDSSNLALYLNIGTMQAAPDTTTTAPVINWPQRKDGCGTDSSRWPSTSSKKTLPLVPMYDGTRDQGNYRSLSGDCDGYYPGDTLALDAGTNVAPIWALNVRGFSVNPTAYGGWATDSFVPTPEYKNAVHVDYNTRFTRRASCENNVNRTVLTAYTDVNNIDSPLYSRPMHSSAHTIWSMNCKDDTDWWQQIYLQNAYTKAFLDNNNWYRVSGSSYNEYIFNVTHLGTTLFRKTFTLTETDLAIIKAAEDRNGGIGLDILADDFFVVYVNGQQLLGASNDYRVTPTRYFRIDSSRLKVGENVLGIEADDKVVMNAQLASSGVGLIYTVQLYDLAGYQLQPQSVCYDATTNAQVTTVASGTKIRCEHKFPMDPASTTLTTKPTYYKIDCPKDGGLTVTASPDTCAITQSAWNAKTYTKTELETFKVSRTFIVSGADGQQLCTNITVDPGGASVTGTARPAAVGSNYCVTIGSIQVPLAYFRKGDVFARGAIGGGEAGTRRSHGDYGVIGNGAISKFSSLAAGTAGSANLLTFANTPASGWFGMLRGATSLDLAGAPLGSATVDISTLSSGNYVYSGDLTVTASGAIDKQLRIKATGKLTIGNNLDLSTTSGPAQNLPFVQLLAGSDMTISDGVTRVGATLLAGGNLRTCHTVKTSLSSAVCNQKLVISAPIAAANIGLYRTATSGVTDYDGAAEVVTYEPAAMVAPFVAKQSNALVTDIETELPPRY